MLCIDKDSMRIANIYNQKFNSYFLKNSTLNILLFTKNNGRFSNLFYFKFHLLLNKFSFKENVNSHNSSHNSF